MPTLTFLLLPLLLSVSHVESFDVLDFIVDTLNYTRFAGVTTCEIQILRVIDEFKNGSMWAAKMLDSTAKLQSGILEGNLVEYGAYDECLQVYDPEHAISGKYCLAKLEYDKLKLMVDKYGSGFKEADDFQEINQKNLKLIQMQWGLCVPDGCSGDDLTAMMFNSLNITDMQCQTLRQRPDLNILDLSVLGFFSIILLVILASTFYDLYFYYVQEKPRYKLFLVFSYWTNGRNLFSSSEKPDQLKFIHGIRSFTIMWVMFGHLYSDLYSFSVMNSTDLVHFSKTTRSHIITNAILSVDTFFVLSGMFVVYTYLICKSRQPKFNWAMFYLHRYLRLTPAAAAVVMFQATLYTHIGNGPIWPVGTYRTKTNCCKNWWTNLLYLQNIINIKEICSSVSWYLAVDTQLFFLSPLLLIPLIKFPKSTLCATGFLTLCSTVSTFYVGWINEFRGSINAMGNDNEMFLTKYYTQTYTRAGPWLIGIILGYFTYQAKYVENNVRLNKKMVSLIWFVVMFILLGSIYAPSLLLHWHYNRYVHSSFLALNKILWAIGVSLMIYVCAIGYGGVITSFLSLPIFEIISKISYCIYLLHYEIFNVLLYSRRTPIYFSNYNTSYYFMAHFMVSSALAVVWSLTFECPIIALQTHFKDSEVPKTEIKRQSTISSSLEPKIDEDARKIEETDKSEENTKV